MNTPTLSQIEKSISRLSLTEQLWLMERLAHNIRETAQNRPDDFESELLAMANDPEIQNELREIEAEFVFVEADGLDLYNGN